jgi:predicted alpha/beta superfamily hydrolase
VSVPVQDGVPRTLVINVPVSSRPSARYPVLYLHDAQNLFDPKQSYTGATWQITEAMQRLRETVGFEAIVVGIEHGGPRRVVELMPWPIENFVGDVPPAEGAAYLSWIVEVVKPYIDANYPTKPECEHTAMIGSSLGGLLTHYAAHAQPGVFCKVGILSPSYWVSEGPYSFARQQPAPATVRVFMYAGGKESPRMVPDAQRMLRLMQTTRPAGSATTLVITPEAGHNEPAWAAAFPQAVRWLFELPADPGAAVATPTSRTASPTASPSTAPSPPATAPAQSAPAHAPGPAAPER